MTYTSQQPPALEKTWIASENILCDTFCNALGISKREFYHVLHNLHRHYRSKTETNRSGKQRTFYKASLRLRTIQDMIKKWLNRIPIHDAAQGWCKGRSAKTAAAVHVGKSCVVKLDIADFFPSISHRQVYRVYMRLGCAPDVARILTMLTTWEGHLAQGLKTSPVLANLIMLDIDARIESLCRHWRFDYTRYGDDITLSGGYTTEPVVGGVRKILAQSGFQIKEAKYACQTRTSRQCVVGVVVNETPNIPKEKRRLYRAMAHNCMAKGLSSEQREQEPLYKTEARVKGCLSHWAHINPTAALSSQRKFVKAKYYEASKERS